MACQELRAGLGIAGAGARLDHGGALPVLAHGFVIIQRRIGGDGDLGGAGIGPQAQIDAEDIAIGGDLGQQLDQPAHDIDRRAARIAALGEGKFLGVVEHHQIDIAGIVQLIGAVLAHRQHGQAGLASSFAPSRSAMPALRRLAAAGSARRP